jgi:hypothetical protein
LDTIPYAIDLDSQKFVYIIRPISNYVQSGFVLEKYKSSLELVDALKFESENYFDAGLIISTGIKFF